MSFNTIMLQLDIDRPVGPGVAFAKSIALKFDTDLIGFCAAEPRYVMPVGDSDMAIVDEMRRQVDEIEDKLIKVKEDFFRQLDGDRRITWRGELGNPTQLLAINARAADLIVLNYPRPGPTDGCRTADPGTLLLSIGRPVLLAPVDLQPVKAEGVLVAWKDTREARRAVVDALPFLSSASRVRVATLESNNIAAAQQSADDVVSFLGRHGIRATADAVDVGGADESETLVQIATEIGADLIVSGAYGHNRIREGAVGGVTRSLLRCSSISRLMSN